jgi:hypothetical protein
LKSPALIGLAWVATVAIAFLLGGRLRPEASARDARTTDARAAAAPDAPSSRAPEARTATDTAARPAADGTAAADGAVKTVAIEPGMKPADFSAAFMDYAGKKLAQGPEGQKELFRELDRLTQDKGLHELFRDEQTVMPLIYPWVKFLVHHDREVVAMMETLYKTAAEEPAWFEGIDNDTFEAFTEGLAAILPGAVDEEQLARFRGYVEKILAHPKESLPEALQRSLSDIQQDLEWWSPPLTAQQVLAMLADPQVPPLRKLALLRRAEPEALRGVDVSRIVAEALRAGESSALWMLHQLPEGMVDAAVLDPAVLDCAASGEIQWHEVRSYLSATKRETWEAMRPFLQMGLTRGGKTAEACAQSLVYMTEEVPEEFVRGVIATYALPDEIKEQIGLRSRVGRDPIRRGCCPPRPPRSKS